MRIDEGGRGTGRSVSRPKADKLPLYVAFLGARDECVPQVVQVVGREELLEPLRQNGGGDLYDLGDVDERQVGTEHGRNGQRARFSR